ncbi:very-short-patch-repair endonuclease [Arthrobacter sp. V4I6]|uniref:type IV toxin-antitoxin system AbiEi family antitoxin domain-containing protein n=1 Tax=unclassified Arthrobacter TaxID=235627 RepID=UPI0027812C33|nr:MULTISPECIES: type IV toxin-antitoxin system AbiEi family antitoxin domain-containing protein [unclassified Arthrobacter]MDQ0819818.1 very-short-patch-repair endonuclease [Arthrobacter sp. V1I7]MDQ0853997.1 very-short-patch-repair endonuclease [Arthrobacter sp. V4I6]
MQPSTFLASRGGTASAAELIRAGINRSGITKALASGTVVRIRRGHYGLPHDVGAYRAARELKGLLTCVSAAPSYGLWTLAPSPVLHLTLGHRTGPPGVVAHGRCRHPRHPWLPVAGLADVLVHALHCLPEREGLVLVQSAVGTGDISLDFLRGKLSGNRNARARSVLDLVIPRADSLLEVLANAAFIRAGLQLRRHVQIPGVGEVDFLIEDCLVVETDGGTQLEPLQVKKDRRRNNATVVGGYLVLRYGYDDVVHHPERMVADVIDVLRQYRRGAFHAWGPDPKSRPGAL